jgi:hypothetical protein
MIARLWNSAIASSRHLYLVSDRRFPRADHIPGGRTLHLVDLENLMGGPFQSSGTMHCVSDWYRNTAPVQRGDHVIVAVNPKLALVTRSEWPGILMRAAKGSDGADLALIKEIQDPEWVASHYDRVIIGSGDGIFAPSLDAMRAHGIAVGILARERHVSRALRRSADFVTLLSNVHEVESVA